MERLQAINRKHKRKLRQIVVKKEKNWYTIVSKIIGGFKYGRK